MKVLRIIARLNVGGPARHVVLLDEGLRARGHDTLLVHGRVAADEGSLEDSAAQHGIRVLKLADLGPRIRPLRDLRAFLRLVALVFRESPDVIHTHTAKAGALGRLAALVFNATRPRRRRSVVVHTFHGHVLAGYFNSTGTLLVRLAERGLALATSRIVTISPSQYADIVSRYRIASARKTAMIPIGLDLRPLLDAPPGTTLRAQLSVSNREIVIGYVGRFVPIKDLATLVQAFGLVAGEVPNAVLVLAGDGPSRPAVEALVAALHLGARVRFVGWATALAPLYATMDICALASLNEGTPVAIIEAMAAGKAVVATRVGGVADVIEDGRTGLLVPPRDAAALAQAIVHLARQADTRVRLGEAARQSVAARYDRERLVDDIERLYASALADVRGSSHPVTA